MTSRQLCRAAALVLLLCAPFLSAQATAQATTPQAAATAPAATTAAENTNASSANTQNTDATPAPAQSNRPDALREYRAGNYAKAIDICKSEIQDMPYNLDSYVVLGWSLLASGNYSDAADWALKGRRIDQTDNRLVGVIAESSFRSKNDLTAISYYQLYITNLLAKGDVDKRYIRDSYANLAEIFIRGGELRHAEIALVSAIMYDKGPSAFDPPRSAKLWARLGFVREQLGDKVNALASYNKALERDPANAEAMSAKARIQP